MVTGWKGVELLSLSDGGMQNGVFYEVYRKGSGIPLINVGDMYTQVPVTGTGLDLFDATDEEIRRFAINDGDLFFTRSSIVPSGIAFCNWYKRTGNKPVVFDSYVIRFRTDTTKVVPMFLYLQCTSSKARKFFISSAKTATMTTIDQTVMGKCPIDLPPLPEQRAIAAALSDVDGYIAALERLIAKKRNIKKGAMQELLTGKRRLPGFEGEWVEKAVSEIGEVITGSTPRTEIKAYWNGSIPWITPTDISSVKDIYFGERSISDEGLKMVRPLPANTLLVTCIASIGKNAILKKQGACNQQINAIVPNAINNVDFLYYLLDLNKNYLLENAGQTATKILSKTDFSLLPFTVPSTLPEQTAIAAILSDMDTEIDALTAKLTKVRNIKQGMMQELLTGRIRLV
jgi:type I restriction enzyme S subunit